MKKRSTKLFVEDIITFFKRIENTYKIVVLNPFKKIKW